MSGCQRIPGGFICSFDDEPNTKGIDKTTANGREEEVLRKVRAEGGFSVFWATANQSRASTIDRLISRGILVATKDQPPYPHNTFTIQEATHDR